MVYLFSNYVCNIIKLFKEIVFSICNGVDEIFWEIIFKIGGCFKSSFILDDFKFKFENVGMNMCIVVKINFKIFFKNVNF